MTSISNDPSSSFIDPYTAGPGYYMPEVPKHSGVGVASFILAVLSCLTMCALFISAVYMQVQDPMMVEPDDGTSMLWNSTAIGAALLAVVGLVLGIMGLLTAGRRKRYAVLGIAFNGLTVLTVVSLLVMGLVTS